VINKTGNQQVTKYMHNTIVYFFFSEILIFTGKVSLLSTIVFETSSVMIHDYSYTCYFRNADTQAGLQVKLFIEGTLKESRNV
jgi:hypothetical protein